MGLPKIDVPTHETVIPSTKQTITFRPFLVKEEKILLTALAGEDPGEIANATKQIVNNCILTPGVDVDKLELFDLEFLILQLRVRSIGETTKIRFLPRENTTCEECSSNREVEINLTEAQVKNLEGHERKIQLSNDIGVVMKYPTAKMVGKIESAKQSNDINDFFKIVWACVDYVFDTDSTTSSKDVSEAEGLAFLDSLNSKQFNMIEQFFYSMPKLEQTVHIKCSKCSFEQDFVLSGLESFFA